LAELIRESRCTVALTGAGISVPSGIPDFRSPGTGIWENVDPMEVAHIDAFRRDPERFWSFYRPRFEALDDKQPNDAHRALAQLEAEGLLDAVVTQNIDRLHRKAGSERLIEVARERAAAASLNIEHGCANANALDELTPESVDIVLASMSLMDVEDYDGAVREIHRVLAPGGELLMSISHPCFSAPVAEWVRDAAGHLRHFAVNRYFDRSAWEDFVSRSFRQPVVRRHRPLEDYMRALIEKQFVLRDFLEPTATAEDLRKSVRFEHLTRVPYFLFMRWQKP